MGNVWICLLRNMHTQNSFLQHFFFFIFLPSFSEHLNHSERNNGTNTALRWTTKNKKKKTNPTSFKCRLRTVMKKILLPLKLVCVMQLSETLKGFPLSSGFFFCNVCSSLLFHLTLCRLQCQANKKPTKECGALWIFTVEEEAPQKNEWFDDAANQFKMQNQDTKRVKQRKMKQQVVSIVYHFQSSLEIGLIVFLLQFSFFFRFQAHCSGAFIVCVLNFLMVVHSFAVCCWIHQNRIPLDWSGSLKLALDHER